MKRNDVKRGQLVETRIRGHMRRAWVEYRRYAAGERGGNAKQDVWAVVDVHGVYHDCTPRQLRAVD